MGSWLVRGRVNYMDRARWHVNIVMVPMFMVSRLGMGVGREDAEWMLARDGEGECWFLGRRRWWFDHTFYSV